MKEIGGGDWCKRLVNEVGEGNLVKEIGARYWCKILVKEIW